MHTPWLADTYVANDPSARLDGRMVERVPDPFSDRARTGMTRYAHLAAFAIEATAPVVIERL